MRGVFLFILSIHVGVSILSGCRKGNDGNNNSDYELKDTVIHDTIIQDTVYVDTIIYHTIYTKSFIHDSINLDSIIHDTIVLFGFSVLGNSISTYEGYVPDDYINYYTQSKIDVNSTWWMRFSQISRISLNSNASWSGSTVSSAKMNSDSWFFSDRRINDLSTNGIPKYIIILGGTNDWSCGNCDLGTSHKDLNPRTFSGAYSLLLSKLKKRYPYTELICCSILPRKNGYDTQNSRGWTIHNADSCIRQISELYDARFIDMSDCGIDQTFSDYTIDGVHPNSAGMELISNCLYHKVFN